MTTQYTISTAKGSHTSTDLRAVCAWQAEHQGSFASISNGDTEIDVDSIDFDGEDLDSAVRAVEVRLASEVEVGDAINPTGDMDGGDEGRVIAIGGDGTQPPHPMNSAGNALVAWASGVTTWHPLA